jgi:hypothetical protein
VVEVVRVEGLEPPSREALDPKSSVSTNFTTPAISKEAQIYNDCDKIALNEKIFLKYFYLTKRVIN